MIRSALVSTLALLLLSAVASAQQSGAVYTTDSKSDIENNFRKTSDVYLAGGPGPNSGCSGNGLADGTYYFQVTDPSGSVLLSTTPIEERGVVVSGGVIVGTSPGGHSVRNGPCGSKIVKLHPFADTPSSGDEYKVWLTPTAAYIAAPGVGFHGFLASASKTDGFKVRGGKPETLTQIRGTVFYDLVQDGVFDPQAPGEVPIAGWRIEIDSGGVSEVTFTDEDGKYEFLRVLDGSPHTLTSVAPPPGYVGIVGGRWFATTPTPVQVFASAPEVVVDFGKLIFQPAPELARSKGYWHNAGEAELAACDPEWRQVVNALCLRTNFSNPAGQAGTLFTVSEGTPFATAFDELANYLTGNPAYGVLAFNLSVQYCATMLNQNCGPMSQSTIFIDRLLDDVLISLDSMAANTLALLCDSRSADTGPEGDPVWRAVVMGCLTEWEGANSGGGNVFAPAPSPGSFSSPYL